MGWFEEIYYWADLAVGFGGPLVVWALVRLGLLQRAAWWQFALGVLVGLTWELPIFVGSFATTRFATIAFVRAPPVHWTVLMVSHTLWDVSLFLLGCWLVRLCFGQRAFQKLHLSQLLLFALYGQALALAVELSSTGNSAWFFVDLWWNPAMFQFNGHDITVLPHIFWVWGSLCFYFLWLPLGRRLEANLTAAPGSGR